MVLKIPSSLAGQIARLKQAFNALSPNVRGALWIVLSSFAFAFMSAGIHAAGERLPSVQIVFFRTLFQLVFLVPLIMRLGVYQLATSRWRLHLLRGLIGAAAIQAGFYALTALPLAEATALTFSRALFLTVFAIIFLGEKVGLHRWTATIVGFVGILVMMRPDVNGIQFAMVVAVFGAACVAGLGILVRMLSQTESNEQIMLFPALINLAISLPLSLMVWTSPTPTEIGIIALAAVAGFVAQWSMIEGFRAGEASAMAPVSYTRLIFATALGYWLFAEVPTQATLLGAALVILATLYTIHREARRST